MPVRMELTQQVVHAGICPVTAEWGGTEFQFERLWRVPGLPVHSRADRAMRSRNPPNILLLELI